MKSFTNACESKRTLVRSSNGGNDRACVLWRNSLTCVVIVRARMSVPVRKGVQAKFVRTGNIKRQISADKIAHGNLLENSTARKRSRVPCVKRGRDYPIIIPERDKSKMILLPGPASSERRTIFSAAAQALYARLYSRSARDPGEAHRVLRQVGVQLHRGRGGPSELGLLQQLLLRLHGRQHYR